MKMRFFFFIPSLLLAIWCGCCTMQKSADETDPHLMHEVAKMHFIWTNWMEKPQLRYAKLTKQKALELCGSWRGSYQDGDERVTLNFKLDPSGRWTCQEFRGDVTGYWYLADGMILLFTEPLSGEPQADSALVWRNRQLQLLLAEPDAGYVVFQRTKQ